MNHSLPVFNSVLQFIPQARLDDHAPDPAPPAPRLLPRRVQVHRAPGAPAHPGLARRPEPAPKLDLTPS